ncbi:MAG: prepilin peptidase [Vampirovibrionales bacterium]|nr:prepilin peptidase [Vampirovibrionales bacterium]
MTTLLYIVTFMVGCCLGSFANVMGLRLLKEEEFVKTPSHCTACNTPLQWYENIPLASWIIQGGRCRSCRVLISVQYPIIELIGGLLFVAVVSQFGTGLLNGGVESVYAAGTCLLLFFLVFNLLVILITDWRESVIFIINSLLLVPAGIIYNSLSLGAFQGIGEYSVLGLAFGLPVGLAEALLGILAAIVVFEGLIFVSRIAFGAEGFGHGDTHLMMGVGAFLGWKLCLLAIFMGFIVQMIPAIPLLIYQWVKQKQWTPLISGAIATLFALLPLLFASMPAVTQSYMLYLIVTVGSIVLSLVSLFVFLKSVKQAQSFTYLPLGPALVIASLICLYFGNQLLSIWFG